MIPRILEPEAMDSAEEAGEYNAMDHSAVNALFAADFTAFLSPNSGGQWLDVGCGPGGIAIELARVDSSARITALDIAAHMIALAEKNVESAGFSKRVECVLGDAKSLARYPAESFDAVVSNSIVHHIPEPAGALGEMVRLVADGGVLFVRDLERPESLQRLDQLVETYARGESEKARSLFHASLHAAPLARRGACNSPSARDS